ncbi:MAG: hypothetical protein EOQ86_12205 [Mesorhizobium sp.]|uniref:hypothetical protein n=1 Tax=Mesorhizobium sp. TaxID=1871066 RepID=UPI000FE4A3FC|nr:hypothetical protein [Mesorhizobium sp.]RWH71599.1 MAG: hypothetical protein EOQ85_29475 [Mesorhizobium sp.]RWH83197.1 MAG: hypothetical protein EOQ86_12205 [Mesorhizobium sp.]RWH91809.1 MAG: hypothetical protein EOQ87_06320 [Mesorhizobium sp.]RWI00461.1 MAG: hypothetical protein EOQ88_06295 [Mesorhizobium sp.]RWI06340.1 MAG: hypothetical protein EOQ89_00850 [Mesorhizobium sp.]
MGLLNDLLPQFLRKPQPIVNIDDLADFMDSRAAFLAQKSIVEFCRVRAGVYWQKLFSEKEFQAALNHSRWRAYPACYAIVAEMVEGALREPAGLRQRGLPAALEKVALASFSKYAVPEGSPPTFWEDAAELIRQRLAATQIGPPRPVREIPEPLARTVFETVPIHPNLLTNDYDYIFNFLRMNLLRAHEDFLAQADRGALVDELLGAARI